MISFRIDWVDILIVQGTLNSSLQHHNLKPSIWGSASFMVHLSYSIKAIALFIIVLPKAHPSPSRMSGSRSVTTSLWLSGSLRPFLYSSSAYSCHLILILSASVCLYPFCFYDAHPYKKSSLDISNFLEEIFSLSYSVVFLYFFALFT